MLFTKNFRSFAFVAVVATVMLLASTSVQAVPATPDMIACQLRPDIPEFPECPEGCYCERSRCKCRP
ncbi:hypothetical protein BGZ95_001649 [Linnemannia exigua]|uniref:Uncharacterized protein n=1 Tax=Linnemannia exigua TaxID=604196 RepID=A0AAD4D702_9FUNG|nr:hypothetical protein BGZ95_001649 [Linnemannia exigua]